MSAIAQNSSDSTSLPFTGERMVPHASDVATELFHWQRYLFLRPWYEAKRIIDAASGEGYGSNYASNFAQSVHGLDLSNEAILHARRKYPRCQFDAQDVCEADYSQADLVLSFETIEHLPSPEKFLAALQSCTGQIVISTPNRNLHSPGNCLVDKPHNPFHTVEWDPSEFADLIQGRFEGRQVRFLSQDATWPGTIREGLKQDSAYTIAVIGDLELPTWPKLGISVPTVNGSARCRDLVANLTRFYPGDVEFAIVNNGSRPHETAALLQLQSDFPSHVHLINLKQNVGYGRGANVGLDFLSEEGRFDYFVVSNDDVVPSIDCIPQLVSAMEELVQGDHNPGVIGPVTNNISGEQQVQIGAYRSLAEMLDKSELFHRDHHSTATSASQLRGLFMLIHPRCLSEIGGFDPRFGFGNFEDDDHNLRCRLAGFTLWIADGAFLHHQGSTTFEELKIDYSSSINRNLQLMLEKWKMQNFNEFLSLKSAPKGVSLKVDLKALPETSGKYVELFGEPVDLIKQASDMEFAAFVFKQIQIGGRESRLAIIEALAEPR